MRNLSWYQWLVLLSVSCLGSAVWAAGDIELLPEDNYRLSMEEVVVKGQASELRQAEMEQELWNRDRFQLDEAARSKKVEWFPLYTKDDRDNYNGVRDKTKPKPEFNIIEIKF